MSSPTRLIILGATGSIGRQAIDIVRADPDRFSIMGLSAGSDLEGLASLSATFPGAATALAESTAKGRVDFAGEDASERMASSIEADIVLNGIAGSAGLKPSLAALESGKDLALANKESLVMAGDLVMATATRQGRRLLPVDSEHAAAFRLIEALGPDDTDELLLTASGGALRDWPQERLASALPSDVLAHPNWSMGAKITVDSATMANKGLEVIEACELFGLGPDSVKVLIHPQSEIHALVRARNGALYAQLSAPDMRLPIHDALYSPERRACVFGKLDLAGKTLSFFAPDLKRYPLLRLGYEAAAAGRAHKIAFNAANEIAVTAFLAGAIHFNGIASLVDAVLSMTLPSSPRDIESVLAADAEARRKAETILGSLRC